MSITQLTSSAETVIIGAGIVGCSIAYHLAKRGYKDVVVIDRGSVTEPIGSTGHAPGLLASISSSPIMTKFARYSAELYGSIPKENPGLTRVGSIEVARDNDRMEQFKLKIERGKEEDIEAKLVTPKELKQLVPQMNVEDLIGGMFVPNDGVLDARRVLCALAKEAKDVGIQFQENTSVISIKLEGDKVTEVVTDHGNISCKRVIIAVGIWGADFLKSLGIEIPLFPVQHPYIYTEPLKEYENETEEASFPFVRDIDNVVYYRQHGTRMGYGWYEHAPLIAKTSDIDKAELEYDSAIFKKNLNLNLFPHLENVAEDVRLNGIFSMTPDGGPLMGELDSISGLWIAEAVWVTHAGGVGKAMAELLLDGTSEVDVTCFHPRRYKGEDVAELRRQSLALYNDIYAWPAA